MVQIPTGRRGFCRSAVAGSSLMSGLIQQLAADGNSSLQDGGVHFPAKAKRVIFLFMTGGVSHVDTFDPKPALTRDHGLEIKADHPEIKDRPGYERIYLKKPQWEFLSTVNREHQSARCFPMSPNVLTTWQ